MRGSIQDVPVAMEALGVVIRQAEWGDMNVGLESFPAGTDTEPVFKGLPDDRCQCAHWGYVVKGKISFKTAGGEETFETGDAYYVAPGHTPVLYAGTELVEFTPTKEHDQAMAVVSKNMEAAAV